MDDEIEPEGTTIIGRYAFANCTGLKKVELPSTIKKIDSYCFGGCTALESIICNAVDIPSTGKDVFVEVDCSQVKLFVPQESFGDYDEDYVWGNFIVKVLLEKDPKESALFQVVSTLDVAVQKQMRNGTLVIESNGRTYNAQGVEIK